jgi:serine/threonine protein kinase
MAPPTPVPGQIFGPYRIIRLLGKGGMGEVYEAEQLETGRRVALKVMNHALASEQDRKRFLREGRLAASVNHPNVVYIHGSEEIAGAPVIAMELVSDGTLKDLLKRKGPLPIGEAVEAILQMIAGLEAAQTAGVLHRDIKPANCFVAADGTVKVGDFGLSVSTLARGESLLTANGAVLGTPAYASPEQLRGEELDVRSDVYSVGATMYHILTGRTPFAAVDFVKLITEVLDKDPAAPSALRHDIPKELSRVILRCLAKDRKARIQTYEELKNALLPFAGRQTEAAAPARRFFASLIDELMAYGPSLIFLVYWSFDPLDKLARERTLSATLTWLPFYFWYLIYYSISEGFWGAAIGKHLLGLRVANLAEHQARLLKGLLRTAVFMLPFTCPLSL